MMNTFILDDDVKEISMNHDHKNNDKNNNFKFQ